MISAWNTALEGLQKDYGTIEKKFPEFSWLDFISCNNSASSQGLRLRMYGSMHGTIEREFFNGDETGGSIMRLK